MKNLNPKIPYKNAFKIPLASNKKDFKKKITKLCKSLKIDLVIPKGNMIAIVGKSGAGKTTVLDILMGFYSPSKGEVLIDSQKLSVFEIKSWRKKIGYVPQVIFLIDDSLRRNVAFGLSDKDIDEGGGQEQVPNGVQYDHYYRINSFDMFNGDWVISILDKEENTLTLARDQLGTKPCFIFENSNVISFCSEIKGFMGLEEDLKFDEDHLGISQITLFEFSKTKFKNVSQLEPGMLIIIDLKSLERKKIRWFNPLENLLNIHPNYEVNQGEYYQRVYDATKLRLNADLKIGTSLSGGLDSSTIFTVLNLIEKEIL